MPIQMPPGPPNTVRSIPGAPGGVNWALPQGEIDDTEARLIQDAWVDQPSLIQRRGPVQKISGTPDLAYKGIGAASALDPAGTWKFAFVSGDSTHGKIETLNAAKTAVASTDDWAYPLPVSTAYPIFSANPALMYGTLIGISDLYTGTIKSGLAFWGGGTKAATTITISTTAGSTVVSGSGFASAVEPGMWIFHSGSFIGQVQSVDSDKSLTMVLPAWQTGSSVSATFQNFRGVVPKVMKGSITTATNSKSVVGGGTKFRQQGLSKGTYALFRTTDMALIGTVGSVNSDFVLTLVANALVACADDPYVAVKIQGGHWTFDNHYVGFLTATFAGRQWYANLPSPNLGSFVMTYSTTTTDADPGAGTFRVNNATFGSITRVFVDLVDANGNDLTYLLDRLKGVTSGQLRIFDAAAPTTNYMIFKIGGWTTASGYRKITVTPIVNAGTLPTGASGINMTIIPSYADDVHNTDERVWFSDPRDPEGLDLSPDGDWFNIGSAGTLSTPIYQIASTPNSLLVLKENEAFAIFGSSPDTFQVRKIFDDGTLSAMSVVSYNGGVVWAGRNGIYFFDGSQVQNLAEGKLGLAWSQALASFDPTTKRMWGMVSRDHYILFCEAFAPPTGITKASSTTTPTKWTVALNLQTGAFTFLSNVNIRGYVNVPASAAKDVYYVLNTTVGKICHGADLFDLEGNDTLTADGGTAGPDFYFESKKFGMEDPLILKRFKQLTLHHWNNGDTLRIDTIRGLNPDGTQLTSQLPTTSSTWTPHRVRFSKKSQYFSFRIYQNSANVTAVRLGAYQLKYKSLRPGRV